MTQIKRADWVTCQGSRVVGTVKRVARDGSWADVNWHSHTKRMPTTALEVQTTIRFGEWEVTDITREEEIRGK